MVKLLMLLSITSLGVAGGPIHSRSRIPVKPSSDLVFVDNSGIPQSAEIAAVASHAGVDCLYTCTTCLVYWNQIDSAPMSGNQEFGPVGCGGWDCPNPTKECSSPDSPQGVAEQLLSPDDVAQLWRLVAANDTRMLRTFVAAHRRVEFNQGRGALQVVGCQDAVVSNVPLTKSEIAALSD